MHSDIPRLADWVRLVNKTFVDTEDAFCLPSFIICKKPSLVDDRKSRMYVGKVERNHVVLYMYWGQLQLEIVFLLGKLGKMLHMILGRRPDSRHRHIPRIWSGYIGKAIT